MAVRIEIEVSDPPVPVEPSAPDAELRAAAEALVLGATDTVADLFTRNMVAVHRPAWARLARACGINTATALNREQEGPS